MQRLGFIIFLLSFPLFGQNKIKEKVYDEYATIEGTRIYNDTQNTITFSDDSGNISTEAEIGNTLILSSLFHNNLSSINIAFTEPYKCFRFMLRIRREYLDIS